LPPRPGREARKVEQMQPKAGTRPVVLIVEDELLVRMDAVEVIEADGFEVVEAKNADDAIALLEQRNDISLIFTDIDMPGSMDGLKLAHFVKDRWPPIKIIATSGHSKITANDLPEGGRFMPKPYNPTEVADTIHQLIQAA
jgi:two-component system, response regulator PdtaR